MLRFANIKAFGISYENYLLVENINDLHSYYENFRKRQIFNATDDLRNNKNRLKLAGFAETDFLIRYGYKHNIKAIRLFADTIGSVYKDQLKFLLDGKKIAINLIGGYFPLPDDFSVEEINLTSINDIFKPIHINHDNT